MTFEQDKIYRTFKNQILSDLVLKWFFSEYDVYYTDNCPYDFLFKDSGYETMKSLRQSWVFGSSGYISQIHRYHNFYDRLFEYITVKDNPNSLRQKINILHIMNECNFKPNNPIHITIHETKNNGKVLDLDDKTTWNDFGMIVHPGHTRVLASVFMKRNILSNLFYVKKKWNVQVKGQSVIKIKSNTFKSLFFDKFGRNEQNTNEFKIFSWWYQNDVQLKDLVKISHEEGGEVFGVLKLFDYFDIKYNKLRNRYKLRNRSVGNSYISDTFAYSNAYFKILFNNNFNIYTHDIDYVIDILNKNLMNLFSENEEDFSVIKNSFSDFINGNLFKLEAMMSGIKNQYNEFDDNEKYIFDKFNEFVKNIQIKKTITNDYQNFLFKSQNRYKITKDNNILNNILEKNKFKGFALYIDSTKLKKFYRTLPELLYIANPTVSLVKSNGGEFSIINCEHEYWKTGKNYKEIVIQKSFYEN